MEFCLEKNSKKKSDENLQNFILKIVQLLYRFMKRIEFLNIYYRDTLIDLIAQNGLIKLNPEFSLIYFKFLKLRICLDQSQKSNEILFLENFKISSKIISYLSKPFKDFYSDKNFKENVDLKIDDKTQEIIGSEIFLLSYSRLNKLGSIMLKIILRILKNLESKPKISQEFLESFMHFCNDIFANSTQFKNLANNLVNQILRILDFFLFYKKFYSEQIIKSFALKYYDFLSFNGIDIFRSNLHLIIQPNEKQSKTMDELNLTNNSVSLNKFQSDEIGIFSFANFNPDSKASPNDESEISDLQIEKDSQFNLNPLKLKKALSVQQVKPVKKNKSSFDDATPDIDQPKIGKKFKNETLTQNEQANVKNELEIFPKIDLS